MSVPSDLPALPGVTVVVPVYKGGDLVRRTVDALLAQTYPACQVLLVSDGSPDPRDRALGSDYAGRVTFVEQANKGLCGTLNHAIDHLVTTPLVARCDQDDIAHPDRIQKQVDALLATGADACFTKINKIVASGRVMAVHPDVPELRYTYDPDVHGAIVHSTLLARTDFLRRLGGYRQELYPCDDFDLCFRMHRGGQVVVVGEALVDYLIHDQANTFTHFWDMQIKTQYLLWCDRTGREDVPYAQWYETQGRAEAGSLRARVDGLGRLYYRRAGLHIGNGRLLAGASLLLASGLLSPRFTLHRLRNAARTARAGQAR